MSVVLEILKRLLEKEVSGHEGEESNHIDNYHELLTLYDYGRTHKDAKSSTYHIRNSQETHTMQLSHPDGENVNHWVHHSSIDPEVHHGKTFGDLDYHLYVKSTEEPFGQKKLPKEVEDRVVPAIKHPITGQIYRGKRGQTHEEVAAYHKIEPELNELQSRGEYHPLRHSGFYDPKTKEFHSRGDTGIDSTTFMTKAQRFRKYGTESIAAHG
jgi:hypothetical protein